MLFRWGRGVIPCALLLLSSELGSAAAQTGSPAQTQTAEPKTPDVGTGSPRILGVVPQFGVTNQQDAPPLSTKQKLSLFEKGAFDPFNFASAGFQAGLSQATNEFAGYGQGAAGYGKRYGATFADQVSSNFFANFVYSSLFKEDPRYFRVGQGPVKRRLAQAVEQEFVARKDSGGKTFAFENILGAFTSGTLSNAYYPGTDRGVGLTISRSTIAILYGTAGNALSEFWPDIQARIFHSKKHK